jgi:hypothetical protein
MPLAMQRLDLKSARYDRLSDSVLINGRGCVIEISHEAVELAAHRPMEPEEAVRTVVEEARMFAFLASRLPADDGKIHITAKMLVNDGMFGEDREP